jgi:hypothetical protein
MSKERELMSYDRSSKLASHRSNRTIPCLADLGRARVLARAASVELASAGRTTESYPPAPLLPRASPSVELVSAERTTERYMPARAESQAPTGTSPTEA